MPQLTMADPVKSNTGDKYNRSLLNSKSPLWTFKLCRSNIPSQSTIMFLVNTHSDDLPKYDTISVVIDIFAQVSTIYHL